MKTSLKNINKYEMHVNLGISVHLSLKRLSPLKSVNFLRLQPHAAVIFQQVQLTVLKRVPCRCLLNANFTISETSLS